VCGKPKISSNLVLRKPKPSKNLTSVQMVFRQKLQSAIQISNDKE